MNDHRYILETGSKKHLCPDCEKKRFVRYIDTETGNYLPEQYGRCDRENKCSYHLNPYNDGYGRDINTPKRMKRIPMTKAKPSPVYIPFDIFNGTLQPERYAQNTFIQNLLNNVPYPFEAGDIERIISMYFLGTIANGYRANAVTFPFIDTKGNIRAVQVKQFDQGNHTAGTDFLHSIIEKHHSRNNKPLPKWLQDYTGQAKRITCLFGEHLLSKFPTNPVALVEAPKTAIYGTLYFGFPDTLDALIWLAVYNKSSFTFDKIKALQGRHVVVFSDLSKDGSTFKDWKAKAREFEKQLPGTSFVCSDLLEQYAPDTDKTEGLDLADYLIKQDWKQFREPHPEPEPTTGSPQAEYFRTIKKEPATVQPLKEKEPEPNKQTEFSDTIKKNDTRQPEAAKPVPETEYFETIKKADTPHDSILSTPEPRTQPQANPAALQPDNRKSITAYVDTTGRLFIPTPLNDSTLTLYPDTDSYNNRLCLPEFVPADDYPTSDMKAVQIDLESLIIKK